MKNRYSTQILWSQEDKAFLAAVPELPGCVADGPTREAALEALGVVLGEWLAVAKKEGRPIPPPLDCAAQAQVFDAFRNSLQEHVQKEVRAAVQRVMQDLAGKIPALGPGDPADWWKRP